MKGYWVWKITVRRQSREGPFDQEDYLISRHGNLLDVGPDIQKRLSEIDDNGRVIHAERQIAATLVDDEKIVNLEKLAIDHAKLINRMVDVETFLLQVANGKSQALSRDDCRKLAQKLACPRQ